ncbi:M23 family metallopeptidase [Amphibacillus sp. Q70]|uniref:M23 family metallopeptidase n=1 Tax=Amphibacillus sp. Q70 TaxID=3453416 RepID=UPI003F847DE7
MTWQGYRVTSPFGWRNHPIRGGREFHTGIDLVKSHKAGIEAFTAGKVLYAGQGKTGTGLGGYGNVVLIGDKNGRGQLYAHLHDVLVQTGQDVARGQVIGRQGATGQVTGSHLHYEVRKKAEGKAPYGWIADRANNCLDPTKYIDNFSQDGAKKANLTVDGKWGNNTTKALQQALGTPVDGIISNQRRNAVTNAMYGTTVKFSNSKNSNVVVALQNKLGSLKADGLLGPATVRRLQRNLGTVQDGVLSRPSLVVEEMQRRLNAGTF